VKLSKIASLTLVSERTVQLARCQSKYDEAVLSRQHGQTCLATTRTNQWSEPGLVCATHTCFGWGSCVHL